MKGVGGRSVETTGKVRSMTTAGLATLYVAQEFLDTELRLEPKEDKAVTNGLARVIADITRATFVPFSAVLSGIKDIKEVMATAERRRRSTGKRTIVFIDEIHRFNKAQQDALLPAVETGLLTLIGATTENPYFEVNAPLMSRSTLFRLEPLGPADLTELAHRGLAAEGAAAEDDEVTGRGLGQGGQHIGAEVHRQDLHHREGRRDAEGHHRQERRGLREVRHQDVGDELADVAHHAAAEAHRLDDRREVVVQQHDVRRFFGNIHGPVHRQADVGRVQRGGVVDTVAAIPDDMPGLFERPHDPLFLIRLDFGEHVDLRHARHQRFFAHVPQFPARQQVRVGDPDFVGNVHGDQAMVAGDHLERYAERVQSRQRVADAGLRRFIDAGRDPRTRRANPNLLQMPGAGVVARRATLLVLGLRIDRGQGRNDWRPLDARMAEK